MNSYLHATSTLFISLTNIVYIATNVNTAELSIWSTNSHKWHIGTTHLMRVLYVISTHSLAVQRRLFTKIKGKNDHSEHLQIPLCHFYCICNMGNMPLC